MKKLFTLVLAIAMIATMSVSAFAATSNGGNTTITVKGTYNGSDAAGDTISVDVAWGEMEFTYTPASQGSWDPATHTYKDATTAGWTANGNTITVTNHSDVAITASFTFAKAEGTNVEGSFTADSLDLNRAEAGSALDSQKGEVTFSITGGSIAATTDLGTITVNIAKKAN